MADVHKSRKNDAIQHIIGTRNESMNQGKLEIVRMEWLHKRSHRQEAPEAVQGCEDRALWTSGSPGVGADSTAHNTH